MARRRKSRSTKKTTAIARGFRSIFAILILTTLVLGISFVIREIASLDAQKVAELSGPYLTRLGIQDEAVGQVAGEFAKRVSETNIAGSAAEVISDAVNSSDSTTDSSISNKDTPSANKTNNVSTNINDYNEDDVMFSVAVFADSHNDSNNLNIALEKASEIDAQAIFHLGDHTNLGLIDDLQDSYDILSNSGIESYSIPGDRDLWQAVGPDNFIEVFGENKHSITIQGTKFVLLDNSANYTAISVEDMDWFASQLEDADFVMFSQPLYHPTSSKVMGVANDGEVASLIKQREQLLKLIRESNVKAIFAAEHHMSNVSTDPQKDTLYHIVVGAITETINDTPQKYLQTPRFTQLLILDDGQFAIDQIILAPKEQ